MSDTNMIMIVDDDDYVVKSLSFVLKKEGFHIKTASDGEDAMRKIQDTKPSLMFLDVMMPKKNGYEVCKEIKDSPNLRDIYIIMLSAKGQEADRNKGLSAGADEFMTKPFSPVKTVERIKELLK